jgi:hypothetical protein
MNIRRLVLDVDKAIRQPELIKIAEAIEEVAGIEGVNITVTEIDIETIGMNITVEGIQIDHEVLIRAIESTGAVVHSIDELAVGDRLIEGVPRQR